VPAYGPQNDVTLKMPAFEWVHVQLHQQKGMISLSPPTICNSAIVSAVRVPLSQSCSVRQVMGGRARALPKSLRIPVQGIISAPFMAGKKTDKRRLFRRLLS
ncbi:hypothetical protein, partial [Escherichia coli]|uniref:hypothetical protein n=1 Tax=Escherichia coli TaxID=562 RepID=UPI003C2C3DB8